MLTLKLLDYSGKEKLVEVEENANVRITMLSGDMVMMEPEYVDSCNTYRLNNYYDGEVKFKATKANVKKLNDCESNYDIFRIKFDEEKEL